MTKHDNARHVRHTIDNATTAGAWSSWIPCVAVVICFLSCNSLAKADKVFTLNNYPAAQDGGSLSGSITVKDESAE